MAELTNLCHGWPTSRQFPVNNKKSDQIEKETGTHMTPQEIAEFEKPLLAKYEEEGSPYYATARLWDDGVIQVEDTRRVIGQALRVASKDTSQPKRDGNTYGVFRT